MSSYSVFEAGAPTEWFNGEFPHPAFKKPVRGKQFLSERLSLTGMEISLNSLPAKYAVPFLHTHREHEELYLFISGQGELLVDGETITVGPGTAVRVAPAGKRAWRNTGDESLVYLVVQAKAGTLSATTIADGQVEKDPPVWKS
jgi:mannose-6-phosphate isomerase-like protein (cupin superfamily)